MARAAQQTYKATAEGHTPEVVALRSRSEEVVGDPLSEPRMKAGSQLFVNHGFGGHVLLRVRGSTICSPVFGGH